MSRSTARHVQTITDRKTRLGFGKHAGEMVQDVLDNEPQYILWLQENTDIDFHHSIIEEAEEGGKPNHEFKGWSDRPRD